MPPILCPICKKPVLDAPANRTYPFCGERCKLIDLGRWLDGKYFPPLTRERVDAEIDD
jgi:uncharacterized protein